MDKEAQPDQWARLKEIIDERNPKNIGINQSEHWQHADGMVLTDYQEMIQALGNENTAKLVSAEMVA